MVTDRQGNAVSGATPAAVEHFDQAVREFNVYRVILLLPPTGPSRRRPASSWPTS
jgi:hypothetical protein